MECSICFFVASESSYDVEFDYFLKGRDSLRMDVNSLPAMTGLTKEQVCIFTLCISSY